MNMVQIVDRFLRIIDAPVYWGARRVCEWGYSGQAVSVTGFYTIVGTFVRDGVEFAVEYEICKMYEGKLWLTLRVFDLEYDITFLTPDNTTMAAAVYSLVNSAASDVEEMFK